MKKTQKRTQLLELETGDFYYKYTFEKDNNYYIVLSEKAFGDKEVFFRKVGWDKDGQIFFEGLEEADFKDVYALFSAIEDTKPESAGEHYAFEAGEKLTPKKQDEALLLIDRVFFNWKNYALHAAIGVLLVIGMIFAGLGLFFAPFHPDMAPRYVSGGKLIGAIAAMLVLSPVCTLIGWYLERVQADNTGKFIWLSGASAFFFPFAFGITDENYMGIGFLAVWVCIAGYAFYIIRLRKRGPQVPELTTLVVSLITKISGACAAAIISFIIYACADKETWSVVTTIRYSIRIMGEIL